MIVLTKYNVSVLYDHVYKIKSSQSVTGSFLSLFNPSLIKNKLKIKLKKKVKYIYKRW